MLAKGPRYGIKSPGVVLLFLCRKKYHAHFERGVKIGTADDVEQWHFEPIQTLELLLMPVGKFIRGADAVRDRLEIALAESTRITAYNRVSGSVL